MVKGKVVCKVKSGQTTIALMKMITLIAEGKTVWFLNDELLLWELNRKIKELIANSQIVIPEDSATYWYGDKDTWLATVEDIIKVENNSKAIIIDTITKVSNIDFSLYESLGIDIYFYCKEDFENGEE